MPMSDTLRNSLLLLIFKATTFANIAINATSSPITNIYASGHTADPGSSGNQTTSESTYTSYARVAILRTSGGWTVTANVVNPVAAITFPTGTGGSGVMTYGGFGTLSTGAGVLLLSGLLSPSITCGNGLPVVWPATTSITFT